MRIESALGGFAVLVSIVWMAMIIGVLVLGVLAIRWLWIQGGRSGQPPATPGPRPDDPLEVLRQRYARGEIDDEEYERRKRTLGG